MAAREFVAGRKLPDLYAFVARWEALVAAERLRSACWTASALVGGDLLAHFCAAAGLASRRLGKAGLDPTSPGERHVRMLQPSNRAIGGHVSLRDGALGAREARQWRAGAGPPRQRQADP